MQQNIKQDVKTIAIRRYLLANLFFPAPLTSGKLEVIILLSHQ